MDDLRQRILRHTENGPVDTAIAGLRLIRVDASKPVTGSVIYRPMICVIAQGRKTIRYGDSRLRYDPGNYLISAVDLPITGTVRNAAPDQPYLSLSFAINQGLLSEILPTMPIGRAPATPTRAISVGALDSELVDCFVRLIRLLETPSFIPSIAPLIEREIPCRLLLGRHGYLLQQGAALEGDGPPITQVIRWIRLHYAEQVRLQEARRILLNGEPSAAAGFQVGYGSPSQFSREYHRAFGKPPRQDVSHTIGRQA